MGQVFERKHFSIYWIAWLWTGPFTIQEMYDDEPSVWDDILRLAVKDLAEVQHSGIQLYGGDKLYPICLGNKGDWSYLEPGAMIMHNFVWGMYIIFPVKMMFFFWVLFEVPGFFSPFEALLPSCPQRWKRQFQNGASWNLPPVFGRHYWPWLGRFVSFKQVVILFVFPFEIFF